MLLVRIRVSEAWLKRNGLHNGKWRISSEFSHKNPETQPPMAICSSISPPRGGGFDFFITVSRAVVITTLVLACFVVRLCGVPVGRLSGVPEEII